MPYPVSRPRAYAHTGDAPRLYHARQQRHAQAAYFARYAVFTPCLIKTRTQAPTTPARGAQARARHTQRARAQQARYLPRRAVLPPVCAVYRLRPVKAHNKPYTPHIKPAAPPVYAPHRHARRPCTRARALFRNICALNRKKCAKSAYL